RGRVAWPDTRGYARRRPGHPAVCPALPGGAATTTSVRRHLRMTAIAHPELDGLDRYKFGWADSDVAGGAARRGVSEEVVRNISALKDEPEWMLDLRLKGLKLFRRNPMPSGGADLTGIDFANI